MQNGMGNFSREMKTITKNQIEILEIKNMVIDMVSNCLISKLDTAEEVISKSEDKPAKIIQTEAIRKKRGKNGIKHLRSVG